MYERGTVFINGTRYPAIRFTDTRIVQVYKSRRPERVSRREAATFRVKDD